MWNLFTKKEERDKRRKICMGCEYKTDKYWVVFEGDGCSVCTCPISSVIKVKSKRCPKKKW
jgi:hypothetical protein